MPIATRVPPRRIRGRSCPTMVGELRVLPNQGTGYQAIMTTPTRSIADGLNASDLTDLPPAAPVHPAGSARPGERPADRPGRVLGAQPSVLAAPLRHAHAQPAGLRRAHAPPSH